MSETVTALMWFVAVVAAIPLVLWLLKRTPLGAGGGGLLRHVAVLPLSGSQRVVTIEVGQGDTRRWLVLGVTPHSISTLHTMAPQGEAAPGGADADRDLRATAVAPAQGRGTQQRRAAEPLRPAAAAGCARAWPSRLVGILGRGARSRAPRCR
jgi:flagellar protein FliO/FliZ